MTITIRPIAGVIGAEISGVDLSRLGDDLIREIRAAWLEHLVVFFREQPLSKDDFLAFAEAIGEPGLYPFLPSLENFPEIIEVKKLESETTNFGGIWHSDTVYLDEPPMASMLLAREVPPFGGDTEWASMYAAYEALSDNLKAFLGSLNAVHSSALADVSKTREDRLVEAGDDDMASQVFESVHPVVRTHPETGRKALYVNVAHTVKFEGMTEKESRPLLEYLFAHQTRAEFTCRFRWEVGSIALWDNRCAMHNPINDYHGYRRVMHRITLRGDVPE